MAIAFMNLALSLALLVIGAIVTLRRSKGKYPPGPPGIPIFGVAKEHPRTEFWKKYAKWGAQYGNLGFISFQILGRRRVIINSAAVAEDLLLRRSAIYSDRPFPPMSGELLRRERSLFYCSYNERFKTYRKLFHQGFNPGAIQNYWELLQSEARVLVANVYKSPEKLPELLKGNAGAVTMKIAYGYTISGENDPFVLMAEEPIRLASIASAPGRWLVDSIPALKYVPSWFPGAGFKRQAKIWADKLYNDSLQPHNWVKQQMQAGTAVPSFTSRLFEAAGPEGLTPEYDDIVLWTAGAIYAAGADTIVASVKAFYFLMMMHPDVQKRAQAEVDSVIAKENRLPTLHDRPHMPYVDAVLQEVLRWATPAPIGLPHATSADDRYQGYYIPAKTTIIPNIWAMTHDAEQYPDPLTFNPERFVKQPGDTVQRDPRQLVFGFGRRMCPGQHVGEASIFIQMATTLAALDISKALDDDGRPIEPEVVFTTALVSHIHPFKYSIKVRENNGIALILQDIAAHEN